MFANTLAHELTNAVFTQRILEEECHSSAGDFPRLSIHEWTPELGLSWETWIFRSRIRLAGHEFDCPFGVTIPPWIPQNGYWA
jgi:hypothetical protein